MNFVFGAIVFLIVLTLFVVVRIAQAFLAARAFIDLVERGWKRRAPRRHVASVK